MWYAWIAKAGVWMVANWKSVTIGVVLLIVLTYIGGLKFEIGQKEQDLASKDMEIVMIQASLRNAENAIEKQNAQIAQFESELKLRDRYRKGAEKRMKEIERDTLEKDRELMKLRTKAMSCDEALIELGKMLQGESWRK